MNQQLTLLKRVYYSLLYRGLHSCKLPQKHPSVDPRFCREVRTTCGCTCSEFMPSGLVVQDRRGRETPNPKVVRILERHMFWNIIHLERKNYLEDTCLGHQPTLHKIVKICSGRMSFNSLTLLHRCALATNFSTSVLVRKAPNCHAARCRAFRLKFGASDPSAGNLRILMRKRLGPAGGRSLRKARLWCLDGTYLRHCAGNTSVERKTFCRCFVSHGLYSLSNLALRHTVHFGGALCSCSNAAIISKMPNPAGSSSGRIISRKRSAAALRRDQPHSGRSSASVIQSRCHAITCVICQLLLHKILRILLHQPDLKRCWRQG